MALGVGDQAPDFELPGTGSAQYRLSSYRGRVVVIVFYPGDNTAVCTRQLNSYNQGLDEFEKLGAQVLAISAQDIDSHEEFSCKHDFGFPLLADTDKSVARQYGVLGPMGFPRRSVFVIDANGRISYAHRALAGLTYRPVEELVSAIEKAAGQ
jgi:peroxiredoxin Q/BCP